MRYLCGATLLLLAVPVLAGPLPAQSTIRRAPTTAPAAPTTTVTRDPTYVPPKPPPGMAESDALKGAAAWEVFPGCAKAIAAARSEQLFVLGCQQADANGWTINYWDPNGRAWFPFPGGSALQIDAHPDGSPFVIRGNSRAYQWRTDDRSYYMFGSSVLDAAWRAVADEGDCWKSIAVSRDAIWRLTCRSAGPGGFAITVRPIAGGNLRLAFGAVPGAVERLAANDASSTSPGLWAISSGGAIWQSRYDAQNPPQLVWQQAPGCAKSIAAGGGQTWVIGCDAPDGNGDRSLWRWKQAAGDWEQIPGRASGLAISPEGTVYAVSGTGIILRYRGN